MSIESKARIFFGWNAYAYDDVLNSPQSHHHWLLDTQAFHKDGYSLKDSFSFDAPSKPALKHLGICRMFEESDILDILAHKDFCIPCNVLSVVPIAMPDAATILKMAAELKTDLILLGLDIEITMTLGEPQFLMATGSMYEEN